MQELVVDLRRKRAINPNDLPYIDWERPVNEGLGEGHGERVEVQRVVLFDQKGSPFVWVDANWVTYCLQKGWKIVGYGNFDKILRHDGTPHAQLEEIRPMVEGRAHAFRELAQMRAENEQLKAERAQFIAERSRIPAPAVTGDFRTQEEIDAGLHSVVLDQDVKVASSQPGAVTTTSTGAPSTSPAPTTASWSSDEAGAADEPESEDAKGGRGKRK